MELFARKLYPSAASCFTKAGRHHDRQICEAFEARMNAHSKDGYLVAGALFKAVASEPSSMSRGLFKRAAECFRDGGDFSSAGDCYVLATEFTDAAHQYRDAGEFIKAVQLIKPANGEISQVHPAVQQRILHVAQFEFVRRNDLKWVTNLLLILSFGPDTLFQTSCCGF